MPPNLHHPRPRQLIVVAPKSQWLDLESLRLTFVVVYRSNVREAQKIQIRYFFCVFFKISLSFRQRARRESFDESRRKSKNLENSSRPNLKNGGKKENERGKPGRSSPSTCLCPSSTSLVGKPTSYLLTLKCLFI